MIASIRLFSAYVLLLLLVSYNLGYSALVKELRYLLVNVRGKCVFFEPVVEVLGHYFFPLGFFYLLDKSHISKTRLLILPINS